ncbi:MAG: cytochrome c [Firmicutes bacterium]|nr:c-type cytochrome [Alicyclobacillaceae bacterium]MCL6496576.1 cytochrome c [Bacillota bacterium]
MVVAVLWGAVATAELAGCGGAGSRAGGPTPDAGGVHSPGPVTGMQVFATTCAPCHGNQGQGTANGPSLATAAVRARFGSEAKLEEFIAHNMPASNPGSLSPAQAQAVSAYVWQLAGR